MGLESFSAEFISAENTAHGADCASVASAGSGVQPSQIGAQRSGSDLKRVDKVDTLKTLPLRQGLFSAFRLYRILENVRRVWYK